MSAVAMSGRSVPEPPAAGHSGALKGVLAVLVTIVLAAGAAWWLRTAQWPIEAVRIRGAIDHADRGRIRAVVARHARAGFFGVDLDALRADLMALPWVRAASARRIWPDALHVVIGEHRVAATWDGGKDGPALVSRAGVIFRPSGPLEDGVTEGVPALSGPPGHGAAVQARMAAFAAELAPLGLTLSAVRQNPRRGWRLRLDNGITLRLGQEQVPARLERFVAAWPVVLADKAGRIDTVDLRYTNGFAVAWSD